MENNLIGQVQNQESHEDDGISRVNCVSKSNEQILKIT